MKKIIIVGLMLLSGVGACQQTKSTHVQNQTKNMDKKMLEIYKQVQTYPNNPWYEIEFSQDACGYEILINDLPLHRYFMFGSSNEQRIQINDQILKKGKQTITIRLFPPQLSDNSYSPVLVDASKFSIKVLHRKFTDPIESYKQDFEFISPNKPGTEKFAASGQKFFEFKGTFEADVPYHVDGWENSKDLSKENQDELLKETVAAYNNFRDILVKKDADAYAALMYDKEVELAKTYYWSTPKDSEERWHDMKKSVLEERNILKLSDYKMVLYAHGRIVALQPTSLMYKDYLSAMHARTPDKDIQYSFFLHKKVGSNELTPIR